MKNKGRVVQTESADILRRWQECCTELYATQEDSGEVVNPTLYELEPEPLRGEIVNALRTSDPKR